MKQAIYSKILKFVILVHLVAGLSWSCWATSFYPQPFPTTVNDAPNIDRGKIGTSYSDWGRDEGGAKRLYTYYELAVLEVLKGNATGPTAMIREMGGVKEGLGMSIAGTSQFQKGEDVVVLLKDKNDDSSYDIRGMMMGKLNVQQNSQGEEFLVGAALMNEPKSAPPWTLAMLRRLIQNPDSFVSQASPTASDVDRSPQSTQPSNRSTERLSPVPGASASQLQPSAEDRTAQPLALWVSLGLGIGLIAWLALRSSKRN